jgi:hypothetical protein
MLFMRFEESMSALTPSKPIKVTVRCVAGIDYNLTAGTDGYRNSSNFHFFS